MSITRIIACLAHRGSRHGSPWKSAGELNLEALSETLRPLAALSWCTFFAPQALRRLSSNVAKHSRAKSSTEHISAAEQKTCGYNHAEQHPNPRWDTRIALPQEPFMTIQPPDMSIVLERMQGPKQPRQELAKTVHATQVLHNSLQHIANKQAFTGKMRTAGIDTQLFQKTKNVFHKLVKNTMATDLSTYLLQFSLARDPPAASFGTTRSPVPRSQLHDNKQQLYSYIFSLYMAYMNAHHKKDMRRVSEVDLSRPHQWFPFARSIHRKIIYHAGPTNSGKTYNAIEALKRASKGVYCSPLRLLALEQYDRLNQEGVRCSLITGEDVREVPEASHVSCTVEMANVHTRYDVAVIDEIQMIGDECRGSAWTRALLGLAASEVHLCGDATVLELVQQLCMDTGEELTVHRHERATSLILESEPLGSILNVQKGDCIIAFSKKDIYKYKQAIESQTSHKVCVVYGTLPPETRREQAQLFNNPNTGFDVLVATDAVGMGLNLNIRRVVLNTLVKPSKLQDEFGNVVMVPLTPSAIKQLAGRAGRRGSIYSEGRVCVVRERDLETVHDALSQDLETQALAGIYPEPDQIEKLASTMPDAPFEDVLASFEASEVLLGQHYSLCNQDTLAEIARKIATIPNLTTAERLRLCSAPVRIQKRDQTMLDVLHHFASLYAAGLQVHPPRPMACVFRSKLMHHLRKGVLSNVRGLPAKSLQEAQVILSDFERCHQVLVLWLWLSYRLDHQGQFPGRSIALVELADVQVGLNRLLELLTGTSLPDVSPTKNATEKRQKVGSISAAQVKTRVKKGVK